MREETITDKEIDRVADLGLARTENERVLGVPILQESALAYECPKEFVRSLCQHCSQDELIIYVAELVARAQNLVSFYARNVGYIGSEDEFPLVVCGVDSFGWVPNGAAELGRMVNELRDSVGMMLES